VHLDRDLPPVAQRRAVDRGDSSGTEQDVGQIDAESGAQVPGEPVVDLVAVAGPEDGSLDAARVVVVDNARGYAQVDRCSPPARGGCAPIRPALMGRKFSGLRRNNGVRISPREVRR
jgi:hypothetical protein